MSNQNEKQKPLEQMSLGELRWEAEKTKIDGREIMNKNELMKSLTSSKTMDPKF